MKSEFSILSKPLPALALCAALAGGLACDKANAIFAPSDSQYVVNGTLNLDDGITVDQNAMYLAAHYYYGSEQVGATVARAVLPVGTNDFTATVLLPPNSEIYGFSLIGTYFGEGGVCVSFPGIEGILGTSWEELFTTPENNIYDAAQSGNTSFLSTFAENEEFQIATDPFYNAYLVGFSNGQQLGIAHDVAFNPVPEPGGITLLTGCILLPALLLRRRTRK